MDGKTSLSSVLASYPRSHAILGALGAGAPAAASAEAPRLRAALAASSEESGTGMDMDFTLLHNDSAVCVCLLSAPSSPPIGT